MGRMGEIEVLCTWKDEIPIFVALVPDTIST